LELGSTSIPNLNKPSSNWVVGRPGNRAIGKGTKLRTGRLCNKICTNQTFSAAAAIEMQ